MSGIIVKVNKFEGPFELLFHLIEKNEMDIYDIPIASLTDQYMEYMDSFSRSDMDGMSEFLLMAATLLEIKSEMLLPKQKDDRIAEEDPRIRLAEMLIEYKRFKEISDTLKEREADASLMLFKARDEGVYNMLRPVYATDLNEILGNVSIEALKNVFYEVMKRREMSEDKIRSGFGTVRMDRFTVSEKILEIQERLTKTKKAYFSDLLFEASSREEVVVTFCAVLELIKLKKIIISQRRNFSDILIEESM